MRGVKWLVLTVALLLLGPLLALAFGDVSMRGDHRAAPNATTLSRAVVAPASASPWDR